MDPIHIVKIDNNGNTMPVWTNKQYSRIMGMVLMRYYNWDLHYKRDGIISS